MRTMSFFGALFASAALAACGGSSEDSAEPAEAASGADEAVQEAAASDTGAEDMSADAGMDDGADAAMDEGSMDEGAMDEAPAEEAPADEAASDEAADASGGGEFMVAGLTGDPDAGRRVFARCRSCHVLEEGVNRTGPSLYGIFGRDAGSVEGFRYSDANADSGITWSDEVMFEYLENPREYIPGTYMAFPGLRDPQDRADVIAYMKANGGAAG